jgi:TatD DNase family protein
VPDTAITWFDTHVHWDATEFDEDRDAALERAYAAGVRYCLNPSVTVLGIEQVRQLAAQSEHRAQWPRIFPAYGIHPLYVEQSQADDVQLLECELLRHRPVAIGEIGLDAYVGAPDFDKQRQIFEDQLVLAMTHRLPVILHVRQAVEAVIQSIKRVQTREKKIPGGIAHAFNGSLVQAKQLIDMGFVLGFGGSCTYEGSRRIRLLAAQLPLHALVLETDAPDMVPAWHRGRRNEPSHLARIAETMAVLRKISLAELAEQTTFNAFQVLGQPRNGAAAQ